MDLATLRALLTPAGQEALAAAQALAPREVDYLPAFQVLSRRFPAGMARAALEIAILRAEAQVKFPFAEKLYFTRPALEQASAYEVARYRVGRYQGFEIVADLGCSVGGDTMALAEVAPTVGIDHDPLRLAMGHANLQAMAPASAWLLVRADLRAPLPLAHHPGLGLFFDPARRSEGRRVFSVRAYQPPLAVIEGWLAKFPDLGVKISPGVKMDELARYEAEVEFISLGGSLKEAVLWFGELKGAQRRATVLPGPFSMAEQTGATALRLPLREPQAWLYEPDPAVIRAGLVAKLGANLGAAQLDADIAYLTAEREKTTPFARAWAVEAWFPFNLKRLRAYLRERGVGRVVVKKRGSPLEPEALIRRLRLQGDQARVVFLTHLRGRPIVIVALERSGGQGKSFNKNSFPEPSITPGNSSQLRNSKNN